MKHVKFLGSLGMACHSGSLQNTVAKAPKPPSLEEAMSDRYPLSKLVAFSDACELAGVTEGELKLMSSEEFLRTVRNVLAGKSVITPLALERITIDLAADPWTAHQRKSFYVERHIKGDAAFIWDPACVELFSTHGTKGISRWAHRGYEVYEKILSMDLPFLNANAMRAFLSQQELIPTSWQGERICFWGTVFRDKPLGYGDDENPRFDEVSRYVCVMRYSRKKGRWVEDFRSLGDSFRDDIVAIILKQAA